LVPWFFLIAVLVLEPLWRESECSLDQRQGSVFGYTWLGLAGRLLVVLSIILNGIGAISWHANLAQPIVDADDNIKNAWDFRHSPPAVALREVTANVKNHNPL
jgi:hypothetical protein